MALANLVPLTEAATFTFGCAMLRARWLDPERVGLVLIAIAALLVAGLLIALTPDSICIDANILDPAAVWPLSGKADLYGR
ncbi:hypothetical protein MKK69_27935 [Methylobacterium sp. J-026]|uniref:hypothetical protein n=1 Tax=Methylobacterium sp. J-026 TaxID=2836624 RepID=UPI001FB91D1C|nr:hypothetical protein [Methylobacterium sp. J-026]MCJ2137830.1 hypothetical protein [Methylobacterium sp. J-026]